MSKKFNVGDKVKVVRSTHYTTSDVGCVGVIVTNTAWRHDYTVDFGRVYEFTHNGHVANAKYTYRFYNEDDLELVESSKVSAKTKYKPGDVVTVRSDLKIKHYTMVDGSNRMRVTDQMLHKAGKNVKIKSVTKTGKYMIEGSIFPWVDEMFVDESNKPTKKPTKEFKKEAKNTETKPKFKVGDVVVAKKDVPYTITKDGWMGVVCQVFEPNAEGENIKVSNIIEYTKDPDGVFVVNSKYFDKAGVIWKVVIEGNGDVTTAKYSLFDEPVKSERVKRYSKDDFSVAKAVEAVTSKLFPEEVYVVEVQFKDDSKTYSYLTKDRDIASVGDYVVVPVGKDNREVTAKVVTIKFLAEVYLPVPLSQMKYVIRKTDKPEKHESDFKVGDFVEVVKSDGCVPVGVRGHVCNVLDYYIGVDLHCEYTGTHSCRILPNKTGRFFAGRYLKKVD